MNLPSSIWKKVKNYLCSKVCLWERKTWWWSGSWYWKWLGTITQLCLHLFTSEHSWQWFSIMRPGWEGFQFREVLWTSDLKTLDLKEFHVAERERETGLQSSGGSKEATAVSWMGQSKCFAWQAGPNCHNSWGDMGLRRWLNLISCWLSSFCHLYPVLSPNGLSPMDLLMLFPSSLAFTGLDKWE